MTGVVSSCFDRWDRDHDETALQEAVAKFVFSDMPLPDDVVNRIRRILRTLYIVGHGMAGGGAESMPGISPEHARKILGRILRPPVARHSFADAFIESMLGGFVDRAQREGRTIADGIRDLERWGEEQLHLVHDPPRQSDKRQTARRAWARSFASSLEALHRSDLAQRWKRRSGPAPAGKR